MSHTSVLLHEAIQGLDIQKGDVFVDGTLGDGGHSLEVLKHFGSDITIVGIDRDQESLDRVTEKFKNESAKIFLSQGNFRNVDSILSSLRLEKAQRFLFDIGMSSRQIDESGRGFSFRKNEPLVMTFEKYQTGLLTARDVVNEWEEKNLTQIIRGFGEERFAAKISRGITEARKSKPIETTGDLVDIIMKSTPSYYHHGKLHPATRTFQAIRIAVNDELEAIKDGLRAAWKVLSPQGRIAVISFHSLEDRIVKQYFNELKKSELATAITKKPITPSEAEIEANPRSRSAKLRIIQKN